MQHLGRFGTLIGFAIQVCAAGAFVIWPNQMWIGWTALALGGAVLFATLLWWIRCNRAHCREWIAHVEPWHIIAVGLCIAVGGVLWQVYRSPQTHLANASSIPINFVPPKPSAQFQQFEPPPDKFYSRTAKEELGDAMLKVSQSFSRDGEPAVRQAFQLADSVRLGRVLSAEKLQELMQTANDAIAHLQAINQVIWRDVFKNAADPILDLQRPLDINHNQISPLLANFTDEIKHFVEALRTLERLPNENDLRARVQQIISEGPSERLHRISQAFENWMRQSRANIDTFQRKLSQ